MRKHSASDPVVWKLIQRVLLYRRCQHFRTARHIDRGRGNLRVPHHPRKRIEVASAFQHERGERVPEGMGGEIQTGTFPQPAHEQVYRFHWHGTVVLGAGEE